MVNDGYVPPEQRAVPASVLTAIGLLGLALLLAGIGVTVHALFRTGRGVTVRALVRRGFAGNDNQRAFGRRLGVSRKQTMRVLGLLLWLALPLGLNVRHWEPLFPHYFFDTYPAYFLLVGIAVSAAISLTRSRGRLALVGPLSAAAAFLAVAAIALVHVTAALGSVGYEASVVSDPCYSTSLRSMEANEQELTRFARAFGSTHAMVELDAFDSQSMGYLLRSDFPSVELPVPGRPNQTPTLIRGVGLGPSVAVGAPWSDVQQSPPVLAPLQPLDFRTADGITVEASAVSSAPRPDQHVYLALAWSVDASATSNDALVWQLYLRDTVTGRMVAQDSGEDHVPAVLRGQQIVSWFSLDPRHDLGAAALEPGTYNLDLQLTDATAQAGLPISFTTATGWSTDTLKLPIQIGELSRCGL